MCTEFRFYKTRRILDTGRTTTRLSFAPLNFTLKRGEDGKFHGMCILPQFKFFEVKK